MGLKKWAQHRLWSVCGSVVNGDDKLIRLLGAHGIVVFVGPNGSGKSLFAVESVLPTLGGVPWECSDLAHLHNRPVKDHATGCSGCDLASGATTLCETGAGLLAEHGHGVRLVWSTVPLLDDETGREHPLYRPLTSLGQLVGIEHADVLFDEVAGIADADTSASMPSALKRWLQQLRKRDVLLRVTSPAYKRCALPIRQVCTLVVDLRAKYEEPSETGRLWRPRRAMLAKAYDAFAFGEFDKNSGERLPSLATCFYWREDGRAQRSYDTLAQVHALIEIEESGACTVCNGSRTKPKCQCSPDVYAHPLDELEVVETVSATGARTRKAVYVGAGGRDRSGEAVAERTPDPGGCDYPDEGSAQRDDSPGAARAGRHLASDGALTLVGGSEHGI